MASTKDVLQALDLLGGSTTLMELKGALRRTRFDEPELSKAIQAALDSGAIEKDGLGNIWRPEPQGPKSSKAARPHIA